MRCHFTYYNGVKIFIPGCWGSLYETDKRNCNCEKHQTFAQFEKKLFNEQMQEKVDYIKSLEEEIKILQKHIKYLQKK